MGHVAVTAGGRLGHRREGLSSIFVKSGIFRIDVVSKEIISLS